MKRKSIFITNFILILLLCLICNVAYAWKKPYKEGLKYLKSHAYEQAIEKFNEALDSQDIREKYVEKVQKKLTEAQQKAAKTLFERGLRLSKNGDIKTALEVFSRAKEYQPNNARFKKRYEEEKKKVEKIEQGIEQSLQIGIQDKKWDKAINQLKSYEIYESTFPEISKRIEELRLKASGYYVDQSDKRLYEKNYDGAYRNIETALKYNSADDIKNKKKARHHLLMSYQSYKRKNYLKSYEDIQKGLEFEPDNPELKAHQNKLLDEWLGILYNEAIKANNEGRYALAKARLKKISQINPGFLNTEELLSEIQSTVASTSYSKAESIMQAQDKSKIGIALANYLIVAEEHSNLYPDIDDKIAEAKRLLRKELEFRVSVDFENESAEPGAAGLVQEQLLSRMKNSRALKNITILDRDAINDILQEQGLGQGFLDETTAVEVKKIKGIQAGIKGKVIKVAVKESGRERPSYGSARYVSGKRWIPNPKYQQAQSKVQAAQQRVLQAQSDYNMAQSQQNQLMQQQRANATSTAGKLGMLVAGLGQMTSTISKAGINKAQNELNTAQNELTNTPMQIEEDIESDYRYEIFDLKLNGEVIISFKVINYTTSEIGQVRTVKKESSVTDRYIPGDPGKNVKSDPLELPTIDEFKNKLMSQAIDELFNEILKELSSNAESYYALASKAERDNIEEDAIENYMRYIYSAPSLKDERVQKANEYIYDKLGLYVIRRKK